MRLFNSRMTGIVVYVDVIHFPRTDLQILESLLVVHVLEEDHVDRTHEPRSDGLVAANRD